MILQRQRGIMCEFAASGLREAEGFEMPIQGWMLIPVYQTFVGIEVLGKRILATPALGFPLLVYQPPKRTSSKTRNMLGSITDTSPIYEEVLFHIKIPISSVCSKGQI